MSTWSFFDLSSGLLTGCTFSGPDSLVDQNTPGGHGAIAGVHDFQRWRVDLESLEVVQWQPPPPPDDALRTWTWHDGARRWESQPTEAAIELQVRGERTQLLAASDWVVSRAIERGEAVPAEWLAYRQALRDVPGQPGFPRAIDWPERPVAG